MKKQKGMSKRENTTVLGGFSFKSLHMKRMREITLQADPLSPFPAHPLIQIMYNSFSSFLLNSTTLETNRA